MAIKETVLIGESVLRETAKKVPDMENSHVQQVVEDCIDTMTKEDLVGYAAPQLGESISVFVSEIRKTKFRDDGSDELRVYINPKIAQISNETKLGWEGCGSVPGIFGQVERAEEVTIEYFDEKGKKHTKTCSGLLAVLIQHEIDHLNGVLFTDLAHPKTFVSKEYYLNVIKKKKAEKFPQK